MKNIFCKRLREMIKDEKKAPSDYRKLINSSPKKYKKVISTIPPQEKIHYRKLKNIQKKEC